jgi:hypothetical protein
VNLKNQIMTNQKNTLLTPLVIAAAISVIAFSGIGVAAITGNLAITHSSLNPFSSFINAPSSGIIQAPAIPTEGHKGLTHHRGETLAEGKPVNFQQGARIPVRKSICPNCGVVDSILPGRGQPTQGNTRTQGADSEGVAILKVAARSAVDEVAESRNPGFVVIVHMENGTVRTIYENERPSLVVGERVKLVNGSVIRLG